MVFKVGFLDNLNYLFQYFTVLFSFICHRKDILLLINFITLLCDFNSDTWCNSQF